jgi:hypothetical protein
MPTGDALRNTAGRLGWKIDTRGHGGYVVAAGSIRRDGRYRITRSREIAPLPAWLTNALTTAPSLREPGEQSTPTGQPRQVPAGHPRSRKRRGRRRSTRSPAHHPARRSVHPRPPRRRWRARRPWPAARGVGGEPQAPRRRVDQPEPRARCGRRGGPSPSVGPVVMAGFSGESSRDSGGNEVEAGVDPGRGFVVGESAAPVGAGQ